MISKTSYLMYNHRILSFFVFTTIFWLVEILAAITVWLSTSYLFSPAPRLRSPNSSFDARDPTGAAIETQRTGTARKTRDGLRIKKEGPEFAARSSEGTEDEYEDEDDAYLSDTSRSFPTFSRQPQLRFEPSRRPKTESVKQEEEEEEGTILGIPESLDTTRGEGVEQADDEDDEDADFVLDDPAGLAQADLLRTPGSARDDSGLGTSMESSAQAERSAKGSVRRRRMGD